MAEKKTKISKWRIFISKVGLAELFLSIAWFAVSSLILIWPQPSQNFNWVHVLALTTFNGFFLALVLGYILYNSTRNINLTKRILSLLALVSCLVLFFSRQITTPDFYYPSYVPITAAALIFSIVYSNKRHISIYLSMYLSFILAINLENPFFYFTIYAANSLFTVQFSNRLVERNSLASSSLRSALGSIFTMILLYMLGLGGYLDLQDIGMNAAGIMIAAIGSVVAIIGLLPYLEDIFYIVTPTKLLELASPNTPLLRRLSMEAPGTYHHSLIVANLSEAATEVIGGNALLARVGAYYHDIGKIKRPLFFIENQSSFDNPHNQLSPKMSSIIITSHTKEGVELGKEYKLPKVILNIIEQHHGNSVMTFFFHAFQELNAKAADSEKSVVNEDDFRYSGPKPQTREAAVLMLADSCEAAVRALEKPTPSRINNLIGRIIKEKMDSGQLEESALTFQEITKIRISFQATIGNMYHNRIKYNDTSK